MAQSRIEDRESEDWLQLDSEDKNWVKQQAALGVPLVLPWKKQHITLGTCFQSHSQHGDPWLEENPFILSDLFMIPKVLESDHGSASSFHSVSTTRRNETGDHLSLGFGVGVGLPFLCSASVKGTYDEEVNNNSDSEKRSVRASARCATVQLGRYPRISHEAMVTLKYDGGYDTFKSRYGDYFLWGYRLGGDTGLLISRSSFSSKKVESYTIKAAVELLVLETSKTWDKDFHTFTYGRSAKLLGYDTLAGRNWNVTTVEDGPVQFVKEADEVISSSQNILERCLMLLEAHGLNEGDFLSESDCEFLTSNGLVVELVLLPMSSLRDVARWTHERDII